MQLSNTQLTAIGRDAFISKAAAFLASRKAAFAALPNATQKEFISLCWTTASTKFKLHSERNVMTYCLVAWELNPDFYAVYPKLNFVLTNPMKEEDERAQDLYAETYKILKTLK